MGFIIGCSTFELFEFQVTIKKRKHVIQCSSVISPEFVYMSSYILLSVMINPQSFEFLAK